MTGSSFCRDIKLRTWAEMSDSEIDCMTGVNNGSTTSTSMFVNEDDIGNGEIFFKMPRHRSE